MVCALYNKWLVVGTLLSGCLCSLLSRDVEAKTLHLVVRGVDEQDADDLELLPRVKSLLDGLWLRVLKPADLVDGASLSNYLKIRVTFLPHNTLAEDRYQRAVDMLKATLEEKVRRCGGLMWG